MRSRDLITTPGGARSNEDRAGHSGTLGWVIDGATDLYAEAALPAERDVIWLVDLLAEFLTDAGERGYDGSVRALLEDLAERVGRQQTRYGFPSDRVPPACSLAVAVDRGDTYEVARIGDATAVVTGRRIELLATDFFDRRERAAVDDQRNGGTAEEARTAMLRRRMQTMTGDGLPESVFSGHPRRRMRAHTVSGLWSGVDQVLLCTDGFARLVSDYALYPDWQEVLADARTHGLAHLEKRIRDVERDPTDPADPPTRFKRSDDVAAVVLVPDPAHVTKGSSL